MLEARNNHYRHAILLISGTRDYGSQVKLEKVIAELGRTNTVVDSVAFGPGKTEILNDLRYGGPLGLLMAVNAMKKNAAMSWLRSRAASTSTSPHGRALTRDFCGSPITSTTTICSAFSRARIPRRECTACGCAFRIIPMRTYGSDRVTLRESWTRR